MLSTEKFYIIIFKDTFRMKGLRNWKDVERSGDCGPVLLSQHLLKKGGKQEGKETAGRVAFCLQPKI
jgi:hypothetical protein